MTGSPVAPQEARQSLYDIIRSDAPFEQKAHEALELGEEYLGVDNGHLTRIDQETNHWEAMVSTDTPEEPFPPGLELDLGTTYCRRTIEENSPIALHDAPNQGWADDPAFDTHELHCYHGTALVIDDEPYGTVCFVSENVRSEPFSDGETMFAELLARLLERELEREQHKAQLTKQTNLAKVLNRVLRHNLRNDMSVIRGYTKLMADKLDEESYSETVFSNIDDLIQLSQKARELDRIVAADFEREPTDIVTLVERVVETVTQDYPSASVSIEDDEQITAPVLASFEQALEELLENAAKHSGETPTVTVEIETVPNAVEIHITDNGPGLPNSEANVLETGTETPLTHGSGLGLWLAHWVITSHDGSLETSVTEEGTTMTITLPRQPTTNVQEQLTNLSRARDKYQAAFEEAADAMVIVNDDARIVDANPAAASVYGSERRALLGQPIPKFLPAEFDFDTAWREFQSVETERDTVTILGDDGKRRRVEYFGATDIIPGQHLIVSREVTN